MELNTIKELVEQLLTENEKLRGDDDLLYLEVLRKVQPYWNSGRITTNIVNISIGEFFSKRKANRLPSFESIRRSRQKVQEEKPYLKPKVEIQKGREVQRENYYNFATQGEFNF